MPSQLTKDLLALQSLFAEPRRWAKHGPAFPTVHFNRPASEFENEASVDPLDPTAACWCATGGAMKVTYKKKPVGVNPELGARYDAVVTALAEAVLSAAALHTAIQVARDDERPVYPEDIVEAFNDQADHSKLIAWIDRAVERSSKRKAS